MTPKLLQVLACPTCVASLELISEGVRCTRCKEVYSDDDGIIHFVAGDVRPESSRNLVEVSGLQDAALYERNARGNEERYHRDDSLREYVDFVAGCRGVIVDLATGPGGGRIAPILKRLPPESLLIATDACLPVLEFQCRLFKPQYPDQFEILDVDLGKTLPFRDESIDIFCGAGATNIANISGTLREVARCLRAQGSVVLSERFYARESETAAYLTDKGHAFASFESFDAFCSSVGIEVTKYEELYTRTGKSEPGDGLPLKETDEWAESHIYLEKRA
mgnify:CR=1 FL=1|jgi:uncharacterized protein YbaR (Trm112 family)